MRLKLLKLLGFQGHTDSTIEFSDYFNCIVGPTNSGKSSVVRALMFLVHNEWVPDFVNKSAKKCTIIVELDNGVRIHRTKGVKVNEVGFKVGDQEKVYKDFGTVYPKDVQDILAGMRPAVDDLLLNFADQDDVLFLLKSPNATRIKLFGQLMGIGAIDHLMEDLRSDHRKEQLSKNHSEQALEEKKKKLAELPDTSVLEKSIRGRRALWAGAREKFSYLSKLNSLKDRISAYQEKAGAFKTKVASAELHKIVDLQATLEKAEMLERLVVVGRRAKSWKERYDRISQDVSLLEQRVQKGNQILWGLLQQLAACPTCGSSLTDSQRTVMAA